MARRLVSTIQYLFLNAAGKKKPPQCGGEWVSYQERDMFTVTQIVPLQISSDEYRKIYIGSD